MTNFSGIFAILSQNGLHGNVARCRSSRTGRQGLVSSARCGASRHGHTFEVVDQLRINTDYSHHRYDILLRINGVAGSQIGLKTPGIDPRRAIEQIGEYKNEPGNGY
jgi:hypothetical protein